MMMIKTVVVWMTVIVIIVVNNVRCSFLGRWTIQQRIQLVETRKNKKGMHAVRLPSLVFTTAMTNSHQLPTHFLPLSFSLSLFLLLNNHSTRIFSPRLANAPRDALQPQLNTER